MYSNGNNSDYKEPLGPVSEEHTRVERLARHNFLERQRRNDVNEKFITLKNKIPELRPLEEVPRIMIIDKATEYVKSLQAIEQNLMSELEIQKMMNKRLLNTRNLIEMGMFGKHHEHNFSTDQYSSQNGSDSEEIDIMT